jgi:uncharacterized delta-60 repeat protein
MLRKFSKEMFLQMIEQAWSSRRRPATDTARIPRPKSKIQNCFALVFLAFGIQLSTCVAATGGLDLTFGGTGKVKTAFGGGYAVANAAAVQGDGKLVLAGIGNGRNNRNSGYAPGGDFLLARFGTNNLLDPSFGDGGKVVTQVSTNYTSSLSSVINALKIQPDGRILAAGYSYQNTNYTDFTVIRYNPDGSVDTTFGTNGTGIIHTDFGQRSQINAMFLQSDSNIVVAGFIGSSAGVALARYTINGVLDATFGGGGKVITAGLDRVANALVIQGDGKILAAGTGIASGDAGIDFAIFRYTTNGVLDSTFGSGGIVFTRISPLTYDYDGAATAIAMHPGGITIFDPDKIMVAGNYHNETASGFQYFQALMRYNLDGSLDTTFGNSGIVTNAIVPQYVFGQQCSGLIVQGGFLRTPRTYTIGGWGQDANNYYYSVARYTASGAFDTTFGTNSSGKNLLSFSSNGGNDQALAYAMVLQSGEYVLAGFEGDSASEEDFAAARFTSTGLLDTSFGSNGVVLANLSDAPGAQANAVVVQPDGKVVAVGVSPPLYLPVPNLLTTRFALARYHADGSLDSTFGNGGKVLTTISTNDQAFAAAIQPDGKILAAGSGYSSFVLARYNPDGSLDNSFGNGGTTTALGGTSYGSAHAIRIQPDGKIVLAGYANDAAGNQRFALARFNSNGTLDSGFGSGGSVITSFESPPAEDLSYGVGVQTDGKIVAGGVAVYLVSGNLSASFAASRYNPNGGLDLSFGSLGRTTANVGGGTIDIGYTIAIQPDGKILVAGGAGLGGAPGPAGGNQNVNSFLALVRFNTNGSLDTAFGSGGSVITQVGPYSDFATTMALQPDGEILVAGASQNALYQYFALRYNPDGSVDNSFGSSGAAVLNFGSGTNEFAYGLAFDASGRALLAGDAGGFFGVARIFAYSVPSPTLKISLTHTNTAVISWPYPSTGWNLQQNSNLSTGAWTTPPQTINNDGTNNFIIVNPPAGNSFYRLQSP